ncbi:MAG: hypothetical protein NTZ74_10230 [Chloroflexi bacterium]|nr:hypothetical protein [Chloroflexota bacterium]
MELKELYLVARSADLALKLLIQQTIRLEDSFARLNPSEIDLLPFLRNLEPDAITATLLNHRYPNTAPVFFQTYLNHLHKAGILIQLPGNLFYISDTGAKRIRQFEKQKSEILEGISPLPVNDLMDLASRLNEITDACLKIGTPSGNSCIQFSRMRILELDPPLMYRIYGFLNEWVAFRSDAESAVRKGYDVSGHVWDILTILWVERKLPVDRLVEIIINRGFSSIETDQSIELICKKGWCGIENREIHITSFGIEIRTIAEETIDHYYYSPLKNFSIQYLQQVRQMLILFHRNTPVLDEKIENRSDKP